MAIKFEITNRDGGARTGIITTGHGIVHTPTITVNFTPALLRSGISPQQVQALGVELLLVNTLHEHLAGTEDIHRSLGWDGPVVADSGGYQMISLAKKLKKLSDGVEFTIGPSSPEATGGQATRTVKMTPEKVLDIQRGLGIDMMMPLDFVVDVRKHNASVFLQAVMLTEKWFRPAYATGHENLNYIVQGGTSKLARSLSLWFARRWLNDKGVQAVALGGISLGESPKLIHEITAYCCARLPENKPRHLLGVGRPIDLLKGIAAGVDTFDCVAITREARHGRLWTMGGMLRLSQSRFAEDGSVIEEGCDCPTCGAGISRSDLRSKMRSLDETVSAKARIDLMLHNVRFVMRLMEEAREAIAVRKVKEFVERHEVAFRELG